MRREIVEELGIVVVAARLLCLVDQIDVARGRIGSHRSIAPMPSLELRAIWSRRSTTDLNSFRWMLCPMRCSPRRKLRWPRCGRNRWNRRFARPARRRATVQTSMWGCRGPSTVRPVFSIRTRSANGGSSGTSAMPLSQPGPSTIRRTIAATRAAAKRGSASSLITVNIRRMRLHSSIAVWVHMRGKAPTASFDRMRSLLPETGDAGRSRCKGDTWRKSSKLVRERCHPPSQRATASLSIIRPAAASASAFASLEARTSGSGSSRVGASNVGTRKLYHRCGPNWLQSGPFRGLF